MNSKERIKRTLKRQPTDRTPIGFFAIDFDTVEKILGHETFLRAKAKTKIALWAGKRDEVVQSWIEDTIELHRHLDILDICNLSAEAIGLVPPKDYIPETVRRIDEITWEANDGRVWKYSDLTGDLLMVVDPTVYTDSQFIGEISISPPDPSEFEVIDAVITALGPDHYILGPSGGEAGMLFLGCMEDALARYALEPDLMEHAIHHATETANLLDEWYLRPGIDGVLWGTDFSGTTGPLISPKTFRRLCLPSIIRRVQSVKAHGLTVFKHACGNNWKLLDMFVEAGYDAYQSIQQSASMDLSRLKETYGDKLILWGGVSVESLIGGTEDEVRREVAESLAVGPPNGGYIFGTSHSVAVGTKYDNFMAMLDSFIDNIENLSKVGR